MLPHRAMPQQPFTQTLSDVPLIYQGKVRDLYAVDDQHLLMVATDRLSAFDVVLPTPIPGKGALLTAISQCWFDRTTHIVPNHLQQVSCTLENVVYDIKQRTHVADRAMLVRKLKGLPVEAIVRGYVIGSGWKDYQHTGQVCGITLPQGLRMADRLPTPLFTPSTKAALGTHDENVDFDHVVAQIGGPLAEQVRAVSLQLYTEAAAYALERGIIIADTKFEFGLDQSGALTLMDEVLTPDSSRFWPVDGYQPGTAPPSFDKQFVRDYLESLGWNKQPPGPVLPREIVEKTWAKYYEALERLHPLTSSPP